MLIGENESCECCEQLYGWTLCFSRVLCWRRLVTADDISARAKKLQLLVDRGGHARRHDAAVPRREFDLGTRSSIGSIDIPRCAKGISARFSSPFGYPAK